MNIEADMKKEEEEIAAKVRRVAEAATRPKTTGVAQMGEGLDIPLPETMTDPEDGADFHQRRGKEIVMETVE